MLVLESTLTRLTYAGQAREALALYHREDPALLPRVTVSSDAFGSWPVFDDLGRVVEYRVSAHNPYGLWGSVCGVHAGMALLVIGCSCV